MMRKNGFTLIELLIGLTIFSVIAVSIFGAFRLGILSWEKIDNKLSQEQNILVLFGALEKEIHNSIDYKEYPLEGSADYLHFYSIKNIENQDSNVNYISNISYQFEDKNLIRKEMVLGKEKDFKVMPLIKANEINFSYLNSDGWQTKWKNKATFPKVIKIEIKANRNYYKKLIAIPIANL